MVLTSKLDAEELLANMKDAEALRRVRQRIAKERERSALEYDFPKLVRSAGESLLIKENPPDIKI